MTKDSSISYIHMHQPRLADLHEDFIRPHTSTYTTLALQSPQHLPTSLYNPSAPNQSTGQTVTYGSSGAVPTALIPSYLPIEDIYLAPQYQPLNPEDEDDVVPDQHAAYGIARAMESISGSGRARAAAAGGGAGRDGGHVWRDLGLGELVTRGGVDGVNARARASAAALGSGAVPARRLKGSGALMGGRRTVCLR
ncbi:hypothetical protein VTN49DRAFT_238 [Thermomyces lanuginosus]|uniref:uncharacterized protein n=1 Tax=Thermomyces lanuginosus TaxID=5541 RepID=UPI0037442164